MSYAELDFPAMKALLLVLAVAVSVQAQNLTSKYDKFTDQTTVSLRYFHVGHGLNMEAAYSYHGQGERIAPPKIVQLIFAIGGPGNYFTSDVELYVISDEKRFRFPTGDISERAILIAIPWDKFESIMAGKKIEMRLGLDELSLSDEDIKALRDFLPKRVSP